MRTSTTALVLSLTLCGTARAATVEPGGIPDLAGPRSLGLSASIGAAAGNEGLYVNPGAIAARKRYAIEGGALFDRRGAETVGRFFGGSIVDSESSPVTAGISYQRAQKGLYEGNLVHFALAGPLAEGFFLGVGGKYLSLTGATLPVGAGGGTAQQVKLQDVSAMTADAGLFWQVSQLVSVGITGYNLVPVSRPGAAPLGMGAGVAIGSDRRFQVTADWRYDWDGRHPAEVRDLGVGLLDRPGKGSNRFAAGAEALLFDLVPVRAGWMKDEILDTSWWSAGIGLVTASGAALDVGYRQSVDDGKARVFAATLKLFVDVPR